MSRSKNNELRKLVLSALFLSLGIVLPILTGQIKEVGDTLLPMHLPVMLCGLLCGAKYGFAIGLVLPFTRSLIFSMPPMYPNAVYMALELATYGLVIGYFYHKLKINHFTKVYISLVLAQISGRIIWAIAKTILLGIGGKTFTFEMFLMGGFIDASLGIMLQLLIIPTVMAIIRILQS